MTETMADLAALHGQIVEQRRLIELAKEALGGLNKTLDELETKMIWALEKTELKSFRSVHGQVTVAKRFTVRLPKSPEDWEQFWGFLKETGRYESMRTINHQRLNGWYKEELEAAKDAGELFQPPGLEPPSFQEILQLRK